MLTFVCRSCGGVNRVHPDKLDAGPTCGRCKARLDVSGAPLPVGDDALEKIVRSSPAPVLVDFYADWCGPCRSLAPILDEVARAHRGRLVVCKVDTERHPRKAGELGVRGIPAVYLFRDGRVVEEASGLRPRPFWEAMVGKHGA